MTMFPGSGRHVSSHQRGQAPVSETEAAVRVGHRELRPAAPQQTQEGPLRQERSTHQHAQMVQGR